MTNYTCTLCNYNTNRKSSYDDHNKSKRHLNSIEDNVQKNRDHFKDQNKTLEDHSKKIDFSSKCVIVTEKSFPCTKCNKEYKNKTHMYRHRKLCVKIDPVVNQLLKLQEEIIKLKEEKYKKLEEENKALKLKTMPSISNYNYIE